MKRFIGTLMVLSMVLGVWGSGALAADKEETLVRIMGTVRFSSYLNTYGIMDFDGKKYHPSRKLPRDFQRDGLEVMIEAKLRPDLFGARMYGPAIEILKISKANDTFPDDERIAIRSLLARLNAFNAKDLGQLQKIDVMARGLTAEQFGAWTTGFGNYTLHFVDVQGPGTVRLPYTKIEGICLYSRERQNSMALFGNVEYTLIQFTLNKLDGDWKFVTTAPFKPEAGPASEQLVQDYLDQAQKRYGVTDLAKWKGL